MMRGSAAPRIHTCSVRNPILANCNTGLPNRLLCHKPSLRRRMCARSAAAAAAATQSAPMTVDVAIVGAGPAGLAAAAALRRADPQLSVHLFERTPMTARGAAVMVGINGLLALQAIDPELAEQLVGKAIKLEGSDRYNMHTGEWLEFLAMRNDDFKQQFGFHNALLGWSDITDTLKSALPPGSISSGCAVAGFQQLPDDGRVQLLGSCSSSSTEQGPQEPGQPVQVLAVAKVLIGADGWFSGIRQQLLADGPPTFKDAIVYRARLARPADGSVIPEHRTKWWVPPSGPSVGQQLAVLIPVPGGEMVWQAHCPLSVLQDKGMHVDAMLTSDQAAASSHSSVTDATAADAQRSSSSSSSVKDRALRALDSFPEAFLGVVRATPEAAITEHGLYQRTPEQIPEGSWGSGMVTLVGDAAHTARGRHRLGPGTGGCSSPGCSRAACWSDRAGAASL